MTREIEIDGTSKPLSACTLDEIRAMSGGLEARLPQSSGESDARLAAALRDEMETAGAETVEDLGPDRLARWEHALGLHYADTASVVKGLKPRSTD